MSPVGPASFLTSSQGGKEKTDGELCLGQKGLQFCLPRAEPAVQVTPSFCPPDPICKVLILGYDFLGHWEKIHKGKL